MPSLRLDTVLVCSDVTTPVVSSWSHYGTVTTVPSKVVVTLKYFVFFLTNRNEKILAHSLVVHSSSLVPSLRLDTMLVCSDIAHPWRLMLHNITTVTPVVLL